MIVVDAIARGVGEAFAMFWATLWALVVGFGLSGAVQAFVSRARMQAALGDHRPASVVRASFFGAISSSCSYAASALAKSLFARGADFTAAMVFMLASTNLVVELGIVLWLLIGWQFALAEFVGGAIMVVLLVAVLPRVVPAELLSKARVRLQAHDGSVDSGDPVDDVVAADGSRPLIRTRAGWATAAGYMISDLTMLRREIVAGFLIAGFLAALVPASVWNLLFLTDHGVWSSIENVLLGPLLALLSFVCSVGNVPLAAALWHGGISFGGVVSFVFADLVTIPLLLIYRRYYGGRITLRLLGVFWVVMSASGLATEYLFKAVGLVPMRHPVTITGGGVALNYTTILNILALGVFGYLYWLYRRHGRSGTDTGRAPDLVCGMQVERAHAPATARYHGHTYYFCSDRCHDRFVADPSQYVDATPRVGGTS